MKPYHHAVISSKKYGGVPEDYLPIHNVFDQTKSCHPDMRHRMILHNSFGPNIIEMIFGPVITNSDNKKIPTRQIAEDHIIEDLGFLPSVSDWCEKLPLQPWMFGAEKKNRVIRIEEDSKNDQ